MKQQMFSLSNGITLDCRMAGAKGRPLMLFLHGFPEAAFVWDGMLNFFSAPEHGGYLCVAPNLRGYAGSSAPSDVAAYRAKHLVQDLVALKELLSPQQPLACLVAHDWGGAVAWNMANQHPELMRQLAIINSPHPGTFLRDLQSHPTRARCRYACKNALFARHAAAHVLGILLADVDQFIHVGVVVNLGQIFRRPFSNTGNA